MNVYAISPFAIERCVVGCGGAITATDCKTPTRSAFKFIMWYHNFCILQNSHPWLGHERERERAREQAVEERERERENAEKGSKTKNVFAEWRGRTEMCMRCCGEKRRTRYMAKRCIQMHLTVVGAPCVIAPTTVRSPTAAYLMVLSKP